MAVTDTLDQTAKKTILIVDDQETNRKILSLICRNLDHEILEAADGQEAVDKALKHLPDLILMDVMMPGMSGFEATELIKAGEETKYIPVIIVTALDSREDRLAGIAKGADDFLTKPVDAEELKLRLRNNLRNKEYHDFLAQHNLLLEEKVAQRTEQLRDSYLDTIYRLTLAAEYKDEETGTHIKRISHYTKELALALGMPTEFAETIYYVSPMHDIGKVAIPDSILLKNGPLDEEEWKIMKTHAFMGAEILKGSESSFLAMAADIAYSHHERWDGKGYPRGLKGEDIPLTGRIMNICDQYDALRSRRPYKPPFDQGKTVKIITEGDGRTMPDHFDPEILGAFRTSVAVFADIYESHKDDNQEL